MIRTNLFGKLAFDFARWCDSPTACRALADGHMAKAGMLDPCGDAKAELLRPCSSTAPQSGGASSGAADLVAMCGDFALAAISIRR